MKTLTIKQPWADLIATGIKDIENRTWRTKFRGKIHIHVSASKAKPFSELLTDSQLEAFHEHKEKMRFAMELAMGYPWRTSAIIGEVDIVDCVLNHPSVWAEHFTDKELKDGSIITVPVWNWVLANPVRYDSPIFSVKGKLSFWEFEGKENNTPNLK